MILKFKLTEVTVHYPYITVLFFITFLYNVGVQSIQDHIGLAKYIKNHNLPIARLGPEVYMIWV